MTTWFKKHSSHFMLLGGLALAILGCILGYAVFSSSSGKGTATNSSTIIDWIDIQDTSENVTTNLCSNPTFNVQQWTILNLPVATVIIIFFGFFQPRTRLFPGCCNGKPSVAYPVNLLDSYSDRLAFVCAFGITCIGILDLFTGNYYLEPNYEDLPEMVRGAVRSCMAYVNVFAIALVHYPIMVSLTVQNWVVSDVIGLLYTLEWGFMYYYTLAECPWREAETLDANTLILLPVYIMYIILTVLFGKRMYENHKIRKMKRKGLETRLQDKLFEKTHYYERVKYLLTPKEQWDKNQPEPTKLQKILNKMYQNEPGFRYSRRIACTIGLSALCLYCVGIIYETLDVTFRAIANATFAVDGDLYELYRQDNDTAGFYDLKEFVDTVVCKSLSKKSIVSSWILDTGIRRTQNVFNTFSPTVFAAMVIMICYAFIAFHTYRKNTLSLWRGDKSFCPKEDFKNTTLVVSSFKYSGFHIGFVLWGFILLQLTLWLLVFLVIYYLVIPLIDREENWVWSVIKNQWLTVVVYLSIYYSQLISAKYFFLHERGAELSIDNRRMFHVQVYFMFFFNVILGLASCLFRIFKSVLFGLLLVGRIDRCLLMRGFELFDSGYKAYLGFLQLEVAHTHPVVVTFCHFLLQTQKEKRDNVSDFDVEDDVEVEPAKVGKSPNRRARNRWHLALTLLKNNHLLSQRLSAILQANRAEFLGQMESVRRARNQILTEQAINKFVNDSCDDDDDDDVPLILDEPDCVQMNSTRDEQVVVRSGSSHSLQKADSNDEERRILLEWPHASDNARYRAIPLRESEA
ncbi:stimulated by retinoic acid gene 6 protein-like [Diadema setosum]|uniref:stimulated by retinoic acid gene 6 protein-like n=1 Tax=Diadema setosum TaxID=31175 RepID=UPI003B3AB462